MLHLITRLSIEPRINPFPVIEAIATGEWIHETR